VLRPLSSTVSTLVDDGVPFQVRRIVRFEQKPLGTRETDPFQPPWTDALFVSEWPPAHALLLNKFPVLDDHLLLVTRAWADQELPPDPADFAALDAALEAFDGLAFYNGGRAAGASQPHRHLQLVSREALGPIPLEPRILAARAQGLDHVPGFPFAHRLVARLGPHAVAGLLGPHVLLGTRDWGLVVPRSRAAIAGIPMNALGYAGFLACKDDVGADWLAAHGGFAALREVGVPA
jgi:sulfate adenylyltransferase (ADP) / ATP adenylyltransferase